MFRRKRSSDRVTSQSIHGIARLDSRTKRLIGRLQPGEIAVIDHNDLDRIAAEGLVERKVKAVLNSAPSSTGQYPNLGPLVLVTAGVPLIDAFGSDLFGIIREGDHLTIDGDRVMRNGEVLAKGELITRELAEHKLDEAKRDIGKALEVFAENTMQFMLAEKDFLLEAIHLPSVSTEFSGRHALVVVRGYGYKEDLASLRPGYISDFRPVLVGVDGGADALLEIGLKPDLIIGDMDSVSTQALTSGAELVLHAYSDGRAPGKERLDALGLDYSTFEAAGTSEDVALLLAHEKGAELIVAVGSRVSLIELMDKGRKGMASTFLVRLRVGPKLVDAKGVSSLHRSGPSRVELIGLVFAAFITMLIISQISRPMHLVVSAVVDWLQAVFFRIQQIF